MIRAFKEYIKIKIGDKKNIHIGLIFLVYLSVMFGVNLTNWDLPTRVTVIVISAIIMLTVFVPFISWYKVYYKENKEIK